jgi:HD-GYP domain-containing protein (c-di-GMP phosphodiesterase class II)
MKVLKVSELKAGDRFSKPVYIDQENILVPPNVPLKQKEIDRLIRWGIEQVTTEGERISEGSIEGKPGATLKIANLLQSPLYQEFSKTCATLTGNIEKVQSAIKDHLPVDTTLIDKTVDSLIRVLKEYRGEFIQYLFFENPEESTFAQNSIHCAVLSTLIGMQLGILQHKLFPLTTGALLHDVGMLRIPESIVEKRGKLESREAQTMKVHPIYSYTIIRKEMNYSDEVALIALQHHERWDGQGYPKGLSGKQIHINARIVSVADAYEAMISKRPYRNSMIGYHAMKSLLSDNGRRFDPDILKVFIQSMGIYPLGSIVLLSDSSIGSVIDTNTESPLRPKVKILVDKNGIPVEGNKGETVDLETEKKIFIVKAVDPKTLQG